MMWDEGYGEIEYLFLNYKNNKTEVGEKISYKDKRSFEKEIYDCVEVGCPINPIKYAEAINYEELEK